ncbi:MAG: SUMF1/EgtB/PvdO family nonheme iron enzyme [Puniceicoccaceae bacterium]
MKYLYKYGTRSNEIRRAKKELYFRLALVVAVLVFFVLMVLISRFRPRLPEEQASAFEDRPLDAQQAVNSPQMMRSRAEVETLLEQYEASKTSPSSGLADLQLLEQAIEQQRSVIRYRGSEIAAKDDLDLLEELLQTYDEEMGGFLFAQSKRLEEEAEAEVGQQNYESAIELLNKAIKLQNEINEQHPRSSARNPARLHQMRNKVLAWETQPLADRADQLKEDAYRLASERRYEEAKASMQEALEQQQILNQDYRNSRSASLSRLKQFEEAWEEIAMAEDVDKVQELIDQARRALETSDQEIVLNATEAAAIMQRRLIARFPGRTEQTEILQEIARLRDSGASLSSFANITTLRELTREALRQKDMETFRSAVADWFRETSSFLLRFPSSDLVSQINAPEVTYLHGRIEEIPAILDMVDADLVPVPGQEGVLLFRSEVHQALYTSVMEENPSNLQNPQNPVDSVNWTEAVDFTRKLEWILARPVSLPTREIFVSALGQVERSEIATIAWSSQNTNRETQPVKTRSANDLGFHDLLGNVAEWLASDSGELPERVVAIGGAVRDSDARLARVPEEPRQPGERNRFVGFRFMVRN